MTVCENALGSGERILTPQVAPDTRGRRAWELILALKTGERIGDLSLHTLVRNLHRTCKKKHVLMVQD